MSQLLELELSELAEEERARAQSRFAIIQPFLDKEVPLTRIAKANQVPLRTAWRWVNQYRKNGLKGLCRTPRADKSRSRLSSNLREFIEGLALKTPRLSVATVHRMTVAVAMKHALRVPSYWTVRRIVAGIDPALLTLAHEGTSRYNDTFELLHRREADRPNAIWQADHTQLDILVADDNQNLGKPWLTIILDDCSRAIAGYSLSFQSPSAIQTALALRQAIWRKQHPKWHVCGIPGVLYTDHGSDFTSRHIEQVAAELKIRLVFSIPGRPRGRGKIERFFESLTQVFLSRLPGYTPPGTEPSADYCPHLVQLGLALEDYIVTQYNATPHTTTGKAPQIRWDEGGFLPHMPSSLEQLDLLLLTVAKSRRVQRDGIQFMGYRYIDPTLAAYVGETVVLRYDPRDVAEVRVFHQGRFICRAVAQELAGEPVAFREIVQARNRRRKALRQTLQARAKCVESLLEVKRWEPEEPIAPSNETPKPDCPKLKRYLNE